jgi:hypothetical protein
MSRKIFRRNKHLCAALQHGGLFALAGNQSRQGEIAALGAGFHPAMKWL